MISTALLLQSTQSQSALIDGATAVSVSLVLGVLAAAWRLSGQLSRIEERLKQLDGLLTLPEKFGRLETRVETLENEVKTLRGDSC